MPANLKQLHMEFMAYSEFSRRLSPATLRSYRAAFALLLRRYPELTIEDITSASLMEFFRWLESRPRIVGKGEIRQGVRKSTIATYWMKLSKFFGWLEKRGLLGVNPLRAGGEMEFPRVRYDNRKYLSREDVAKIYRAIEEQIPWQSEFIRARNMAIVAVALDCGLRRGELLGLRVGDINLKTGELTIRGETSKSQASRIIPLNSHAGGVLRAYLNERGKRNYLGTQLWIQDNRREEALGEQGFRHLVQCLRSASGVRFHLHQFRHTFAVNFLHNSGHNSFKLRELLGQRSIVSTAIYTRCLPPELVRGDLERMSDPKNLI
jgi:site-specific recombinase XerD